MEVVHFFEKLAMWVEAFIGSILTLCGGAPKHKELFHELTDASDKDNEESE